MIIKNILYNSFKNKIVFFIVFIINVTILISFALVNFKIDKINISKNKIGSDLVVSSDDTKEIL